MLVCQGPPALQFCCDPKDLLYWLGEAVSAKSCTLVDAQAYRSQKDCAGYRHRVERDACTCGQPYITRWGCFVGTRLCVAASQDAAGLQQLDC